MTKKDNFFLDNTSSMTTNESHNICLNCGYKFNISNQSDNCPVCGSTSKKVYGNDKLIINLNESADVRRLSSHILHISSINTFIGTVLVIISILLDSPYGLSVLEGLMALLSFICVIISYKTGKYLEDH